MRNLLFLAVLSMLGACIAAPEYPIEPAITFKQLSKNTMKQGAFNNDSLLLTFAFTDGDGDIGREDSASLFLTDLRSGFGEPTFKLPFVPESGAGNGISGEAYIAIYTTCCYYPDGSPPCQPNPDYPTDTLEYEFYIVDRAGHKSNVARTGPIVLQCNQ